MSQENVELVRRAYAAWEPAWGSGTADLGELLALMDDGLVLRTHAPAPNPGTWHGLQGFLEATADWADTFDEFRLRAEEFIDAGDQVLVRAVVEGRGSGSGAPVAGTAWVVYSVRGAKLVTIDMYVTRDQALEAAGLSEEAMSQSNVEVVRRLLWAFENDADGFEKLLHPESVWFPFEDNHSPTNGIEGSMRTRQQWLDAWKDVRTDLEDVVDKGENVIASVHITGRGKASGIEVDVRIHFHFKIRDGKVIYTFEHVDKAAALEAAGLSD